MIESEVVEFFEDKNFVEPDSPGDAVKLMTEIVAVDTAIILPSVTPEKAIEAWRQYQALKDSVKTKEDIQVIQGKEFLKKSYWRKIARFFNLSVAIVSEKETQIKIDGHDVVAYHFIAKATAPNGASAEASGTCDTGEKGGIGKSLHNTRAIAETRAWNRCVSNLIGGGEVSAEEMPYLTHEEKTENTTNTTEKNITPVEKKMASEKQLGMIFSLVDRVGMTAPQVKEYMQGKYKVDHSSKLTSFNASDLITFLVAMQGERK